MPLPELPEPNSFTLDEISDRWNCDLDKLIRLCESDMLNIGIVLTGSSAKHTGDDFKPHEVSLDGFFNLSKKDAIGSYYSGSSPAYEYAYHVNTVYSPTYSTEEHVDMNFNKYIPIGNSYILHNKHIFSYNDLRISKEERGRFEKKYNIEPQLSIELDSSTTNNQKQIGIQEKRECMLKGWLAGKEYDTEQPLELTQEMLWSELSNVDKNIFPPASPDTIKGFFKVQNICHFKTGRRKGGK